MRKVVIVDDEKWIRRGIIQSIPWERYNLVLAGEAGDGQEAYELVMALQPDLLFMDMRMPEVDGKALLALLHQAAPDLLKVVVSGYSDFEYTKEAIRHKAFDYLLKPVKKEELAAVLDKAVAELDRRDAEREAPAEGGREALLHRLLFQEETAEQPLPAAWLPSGGSSTVQLAVLAGQPDVYRDAFDHRALAAPVLEALQRSRPFLFGGRWEAGITSAPGPSREIVVMVTGERLIPEHLLKLGQQLQTALKQAAGVSFSLGASSILMAVGSREMSGAIRSAYAEGKQALKQKRLLEQGVIRTAGKDPGCPSPVYPQELEDAFLLALQLGSRTAAASNFERLFAAFSGESASVEHMQRSAAMLLHAIEKQLQTGGIGLEEACGKPVLAYAEMISCRSDAASVKALFESVIIPGALASAASTGSLGEKHGEKVVREVQKLVEAHYDQPLTLHQIAAGYFMNTDYLSRLFKKMTGHNFVDYLTDYRISKSKELMKHSAYKNYEIAQKVGYEDYRYFSQIFKKKTGLTIGQYRLAVQRSEERML
ncbi:response regulator transcription factor [Paenibacillus sp. y28]|uniref:response regulator transcription factor n=1 Tax=Paenibacillus sp. y28 TaxID=3129110 RepID=UPI00301AC7FC